MTPMDCSAPWHRRSFVRFVETRLPQLLAERLPLAGYSAQETAPGTWAVSVAISCGAEELRADYSQLPGPREEGWIELDGMRRVVQPIADREELDAAEVRCVGEQIYDYVEQRLGEAPPDLEWNAGLLRSWLPLDRWLREFHQESSMSQRLNEQNWLARQTDLRRIMIPERRKVTAPGQQGRVCPFETPEGTNIGRVLSIALGAEIRNGRLVVVDDRPEAALGLSASTIPFIEHDDPVRTLMGANMMRQWHVPADPEPALVQTGNEPDAPGFWCGRNLLTAFISWGADTFEDGIVVSESCAERLGFPFPLEVGDRLSNRHGAKGTISRILPDDRMPHLADGTPVELVYSFLGCHTRLNFGQIREAVLGRVARAEERTAMVPPFHAPTADGLRERLRKAGLPESGMERLRDGGPELEEPSTVGWVYWGRTCHDVRDKIHAHVRDEKPAGPDLQSRMEYRLLRDAGAFELVRETFNTRSMRRPDAGSLGDRVARGPIEQAGPPSPAFAELRHRLALAGIHAELDGEKLAFWFGAPSGPTLKLARPVPHPWLHGRELTQVGLLEDSPILQIPFSWRRQDAWGIAEGRRLARVNARTGGILSGGAPESLAQKAVAQLADAVRDYMDALLVPEHLHFSERVLFSGRTVLSPGPGLRIDQVGLADEIAWTIFGPLVQRELGDAAAVRERGTEAARALDEIMARSWVLLDRAPTILPTSMIAFRPVRHPDKVTRLHPLACRLMNADFDGDAAAVFLPLTDAGQREAKELLSVAARLRNDRSTAGWTAAAEALGVTGSLRHDPSMLGWLTPANEILWGLARLATTAEGRKEVALLAGVEIAGPDGLVTHASLGAAMAALLEREGVDAVLEALQRLMDRSFEVAKQSGASLSPFPADGLDLPPAPEGDSGDEWARHAEELAESLAAIQPSEAGNIAPQLLAVKSGARGRMLHLQTLLGSRGAVAGADGEPIMLTHGLHAGLSPEELFAYAAFARHGVGEVALRTADAGAGLREQSMPGGFHVLARAMRAEHPGIVFARAAAAGEVDPLTDINSRLFVGLPARTG